MKALFASAKSNARGKLHQLIDNRRFLKSVKAYIGRKRDNVTSAHALGTGGVTTNGTSDLPRGGSSRALLAARLLSVASLITPVWATAALTF